jgi:hypothetical protein
MLRHSAHRLLDAAADGQTLGQRANRFAKLGRRPRYLNIGVLNRAKPNRP